MDAARKVLEKDHFGLEKVKERILETIAVRQMNPEGKGQIICLAGPPGVGKTFLSNCIAIFPVDEPQIILYIVIEKAKGETYAGRIVAPVIGKAADVIIDHMGMSRGKAASVEHNGIINIPRSTTIKLGALMPDFTGFSKKELLPLTNLPEVKININGSGWVTSQNPAPGTPISQGTVIELYLE